MFLMLLKPIYYVCITYVMRMKNISVRLPDKLLEDIDNLVEEGHYSSRTEALREAARKLLKEQVGVLKGSPAVVSKDDLWREYREENDLR